MAEAHSGLPFRPLIVGIGGTIRVGSSSEQALRFALGKAREFGADTELLSGPDLALPIYSPEVPERDATAQHFVALLRRAHGIIVASPGYHGSMSGLVKNALDYAEDMRDDDLPYFDGRAVGLIACAFGWQATGTTLSALRSIVHALRGWPTPLGVAINTSESSFDKDDIGASPAVAGPLTLLAKQVVLFARQRAAFERTG
ncbi:MAG: NAD(P)H-dependent oxidoreductase [Steroidobacteraceae bacterium]|jgi:FMN reductase